MEFGIFALMQQRGYHQNAYDIVEHAVQQTITAEQAGFHTAWFAEHHFNNYSLCPSPLMMVAHCAGRTKTIRLGSAVVILPLYHPARLLSEIGFVDAVSNGRLELGVGAGYQHFEFERFGQNLAEAPEIFREYVEVLKRGLSEKVFSFEGKHVSFPPTAIAIKPVQKPLPPLWVVSNHPDNQALTLKQGHALFVTALLNGTEQLKKLRGMIEGTAERAGTDVNKARIGLLRCAFASDSETEITAYLENARFQRRVSESLRDRRAQSDDGYMIKEVPNPATDMSLEQIRGNLPIGPVNYVIERMLEEIDILKPTHIAIQTQLGDMDPLVMQRQIALWGEKIMPAINKALGHEAPVALKAAGA